MSNKKWDKQNYDWKKLQVFFKDYLFIHIHKTGGSSVKNFLSPGHGNLISHMTVESIINEIGIEKFNEFKSFCVVRNPYDLMVSQYSYRVETKRIKKMSFNKYILNKHFSHIPPQVEYLKYNNEIYCNDILRYENLVDDVDKFITKNNINLNIYNFPHSRKSKRKEYKEYFTNKEVLDIVNEYYKEDFETFNYKKIEL